LLGNDVTEGNITSIATQIDALKTYISDNVVSAINSISQTVDTISTNLNSLSALLTETKDETTKNRIEEIQKALEEISGKLSSVDSNSSLDEILAAVNALPTMDKINEALADKLSDLNDQKLDAILKAIKELPDTLKAAYNIDTNVVDVLKAQIADLKSSASIDDAGLSAKLDEILAKLNGLDTSVDAAKQVADAQTNAYTELDTWLDAYIKDLLNTNGQEASVGGITLASVSLTASSTSNESVDKLIDDNFNKTNAQLVKDYYQEAKSSISEATTVDEVQQAVAVFKAKVSMVQIMQTNDDELTNVYIILLVCISVAVVAMAVSYVLYRVKSLKASEDEYEED
jgi:hypothetical protein